MKSKQLYILSIRYYWYGGERYVREKTKDCIICSHKNNVFNAAVAPLRPIPATPKIFWRVHVDLAGKFTKTKNGNRFIAIAICAFSKYIEAKGNCPYFFKLFFYFSRKTVEIQISHNTVTGLYH